MNNKPYLHLQKFGIIVYLILFLLSILFYKERIVFLDTAYHMFHILTDGDFLVGNHRYGAVVTQIFPYLCEKLSIPLDATMIIYSSGFALYYFICYLLLVFVLKQYKLALVLLLSHTLFVSDAFYWVTSELKQGLAFFCVMFAILTSFTLSGHTRIYKLAIVTILPICAAFFHPILWVPGVYIIVFFFIHSNAIADKRVFYLGSAIFLVVYFLKLHLLPVLYESNGMSRASNFFTLLPQWFSLPSSQHFLNKCTGVFIWIPIFFLLINAMYLYKKKWLKLFAFNGFIIAYIILITTAYASGTTDEFYFENLYLPLGIVLGLSWVYDVMDHLPRYFSSTIILLVLASGVARIYSRHTVYTTRLEWERSIMDQYPGQKLFIQETPGIEDTLVMTWATAYEFWLLSTAEREYTRTISVVPNVDDCIVSAWDRTSFIGHKEQYDYKELPEKYFILQDTTTRFALLKNGQLISKPY